MVWKEGKLFHGMGTLLELEEPFAFLSVLRWMVKNTPKGVRKPS